MKSFTAALALLAIVVVAGCATPEPAASNSTTQEPVAAQPVTKESSAAPAVTASHSGFKKAIKQAEKENKIVMLKFSADWCGPCQTLKEEVIETPEGQEALAGFVMLEIDVDSEDGAELAKQFEVQSIPNVVFVNGAGKTVHRFLGMREMADFKEELAKAKAS